MSPIKSETFANSHRRFGRIRCQQMSCSLGEVLDLSAGGMRIRARGSMGLKEGSAVGLTLPAGGGPVSLQCRIVWVRKVAWRVHELGVMFIDPTPAARKALSELARGVTFQGELNPGSFSPGLV